MSTKVGEEEFRQRLRLIMQQFGSVADLARAVGVSDNAIYKWVSGRGQPSMISLVNLARAARVSKPCEIRPARRCRSRAAISCRRQRERDHR